MTDPNAMTDEELDAVFSKKVTKKAPPAPPEPPAPAPAPAPVVRREEPQSLAVSRGIRPKDTDELIRLAKLYYESGWAGKLTAVQVMIAMTKGMEAGLSPAASVENVVVIGNKPTWPAEMIRGLIRQSGKCEFWKMTFTDDDISGSPKDWPESFACIVTTKRTDDNTVYEVKFSVGDAKRAGLWGKHNYLTYPQRMLQARASTWAGKDVYPDVVKGLPVTEDVMAYSPREDVDREPPAGQDPILADMGAVATPSPALQPAETEDTPQIEGSQEPTEGKKVLF